MEEMLFWNGGLRLHAVSAGDGRALVLLHGWPGFWMDWEKTLPLLSTRFRVVLPDLRGFGHSDKPSSPTEYSLDHYAADIVTLLTHMKMDKAVVGGFDVGSSVSAYFAKKHPELVEALILINPSYPGLGAKRLQLEQAKESWYQYFHLLELAEHLVGYNRDTVKVYLTHFFKHWSYVKDAFTEDDVEKYVDIFFQHGALRGGFNWYRSRFLTRYSDWLGGPVEHKTLIIWSDKDPIFPLEWSEDAKSYFPNSELHVIRDCGHFVPREKPEELVSIVMDFLERV